VLGLPTMHHASAIGGKRLPVVRLHHSKGRAGRDMGTREHAEPIGQVNT
jgi:hypothetical protein